MARRVRKFCRWHPEEPMSYRFSGTPFCRRCDREGRAERTQALKDGAAAAAALHARLLEISDRRKGGA